MDATQQLLKETDELERLLKLREETEIAIARTKRRIAAWLELADDTETGELVPEIDLNLGGLTDACRTVLRGSRKAWISITEIQEGLRELGFPLKDYKAPTASITTTVNRLVEADEVVMEKHVGGANEYKWVGPRWGAPSSLANMLDDKARDKARVEARRVATVADAAKRTKK